ncbi:MAG: IPT/TIG domain-containing protein, partial [Ilumatobacteraceae bacterium]
MTSTGGTSVVSATDSDDFTYTAPRPTITGLSPNYGLLAGGGTVTITGTGFVTGSTVTFGDVSGLTPLVASPTSITVTVPAAASRGAVDVVVATVAALPSATSSASRYTYVTTPSVLTVNPISGTVDGGTEVTITGTDFYDVTAVRFGSSAATTFTVVSPTEIRATTASTNTASTVDVTVTALGGTSSTAGTGNDFTFTVAAPTITNLLPDNAMIFGNTPITITGTNFVNPATVSFEGVAATNVVVVSRTQITATIPSALVSGPVDVSVTTPGGTSADTAADDFTYAAPPAVTSVAPDKGSVTGGTTIVINGTDFVGVTAVTIGGVAASSYTVNSATKITAVTPARATPGTVQVQVTAVAGISDIETTGNEFTYYSVPVVSSLSPVRSSLAGTTVTITGEHLLEASSVTFGGVAATVLPGGTATELTVTAPAREAGGTVDVVVTTPGGPSANTVADNFRYVAAPTVTSLSRTAGLLTGNQSITITGTDFVDVTGVMFGETPATGVTVQSETQITATIPAGAEGTVQVTVAALGGTSSTAGTGNDYRYVAAPTVTQVAPSSGRIAGGQLVTLTGTNLVGVTTVRFGTAEATVQAGGTEASITVLTPASAAGPVDVSVVAAGGESTIDTSGNEFTYYAVPVVTSLSPVRSALGGTVVTITGENLLGVTGVSFGSVLVTTFSAASDTSITVTAPARDAAATVRVSVTTPGGTSSTVSSSTEFRYVARPVVDSVSPAAGPVAGGTPVTITGSNFVDVSVATGVTFGGVAATNVVVTSETQITATVPASIAGAAIVDVVVTGIGGASLTAGTLDDYRYYAVPVVASLAPNAGPTAAGTEVSITGQNLLGVTSVTFGAAAATILAGGTDTLLRVTAPAGTAGSVPVTVITPGGESASGAGATYTYVAAPVVTSLSSTRGPLAGGTSITITGANFTGATSVTFGTESATFTVDNPTTITATVPAGTAGTVEVVVTTVGGPSSTGLTTNDYRYVGAPTVLTVTPAAGPIAGGTPITITGTNFVDVSAATGVTVNGVLATSVVIVDESTITAVTPANPLGSFDVVVAALGGTSSIVGIGNDFRYFAIPAVSSIAPAAGPTGGGQTVVISGENLLGATSVMFGSAAATVVLSSETSLTVTTPAGTIGTVNVVVTTPGGAASLDGTDDYRYYAPPTVTSLNPAFTGLAGGQVIITGTNFVGASAVTFGALPALFTVNSDTSITATAPAASAGPVQVTVTTPGGTSSTAGTGNDFTYWDVPTVTQVAPASGPIAGGTLVTITGSGFNDVTAVTFNGTPGTDLVVATATSLSVRTPIGVVGLADVVVAATGGLSSTAGTGNEFRYFAVPVVASLSVAVGPTTGGTTVVIDGSNLDGATAVRFGSVAATSFTVLSDSSISAVSPAGSAGTISVSVVTPGGTSSTDALADDFTYYAAPSVSALSPAKSALAGTTVTVTGANFVSGLTSVSFGANAGTGVNVLSATSLSVVAPAGSAGTVDVTVTTAGGTSSTAGAGNDFTYWAAPTVTSVAPAGGPLTSGTSVVLTGTGFDGVSGASAVQFGGVNAVSYTVNSVTQITAVAPARASAATVEVTVTGTGGTNATAGTGNDYTYYAVPAISSLSPTSGPGQGGTPVVITGTGLLGATAVRFGATNAASFTVNSDTQITAISPSGMGNTSPTVTVITPGGTSNGLTFTTANNVRPTVTGLSPSTGTTAGGTAVTVTGTNFTVNMSFTFTIGGVAYAATSVVVGSSTSATLVTPAVVATGTAVVSATNSALASQTNGSFAYTAAVPTVTGVSPSTGPTSGGTSVTITGTGFITGATVKFGSLSATGVVVNSPTSITAVSPATITPGLVAVTVTTSGGSSTPAGAQGAAADDFTYQAVAPTVASIAPATGGSAGGTSVAITGTGFITGSTVSFGGLAATVVSITPTVITVTSPATTALGTVDVVVTNSVASSDASGTADDFTYTASVPAVSSLSPSTGPVTGGTEVTVTGTGFVTGASVTVGGLAVPSASVTVVSATSITIVTPATVAVGVAN